jgi:hypothetical protein
LSTSRRLLWIEARFLRRSRAQSLDYGEITLARHRNMILFSRAEFLTQRHENFTLTVTNSHIRFTELAVNMISNLAGLDAHPPQLTSAGAPRPATLPR